jgi:hypothetical protein
MSVTKTPEQLVIGDVIPIWGDDLVVNHVEFETDLTASGARTAIVTFEDGTRAVYAPGTQIAVL